MSTAEKLINDLDVSKLMLCNSQTLTPELRIRIGQAINSAIDLLKEQEPRVLTLEELKNNDDNPCWFESHGTYMGYEGFWVIPYAFTAWNTMYYVFPLMQINERGDSHCSELGLSAYNKAWRCWTSRPTDEQRKATLWN